MITLEAADLIEGDASAANVVDFTINGVEETPATSAVAVKALADGQLAATKGTLYTTPASTTAIIKSIILVNTDSSARTVNLYIQRDGTNSRRIIPEALSLGADGGTVILGTDGMQVYTATGSIQTSGSTGPTGAGATGATGATGDTGTGATGAKGDTGTGATGAKGDTGIGATGAKGDTGTGATGAKGDTGTGATGATGATGDTGSAPTGQLFLTAQGGWPSTTSGSAWPDRIEMTTYDVDLYAIAFDKDAVEYCQWMLAMPSDWDASTVTWNAYWTANTSDTGTAEWEFQGVSFANSDDLDNVNWGTATTVADAHNLNAYDLNIGDTGAATTLAGGPAAGELVFFRLGRDADTGADTLGVDALLLGVMVHFGRT